MKRQSGPFVLEPLWVLSAYLVQGFEMSVSAKALSLREKLVWLCSATSRIRMNSPDELKDWPCSPAVFPASVLTNGLNMTVASQLALAGVVPRGIVHIGAHGGQELPEYLQLLDDGPILLVEPQPDLAEVLKKKSRGHERVHVEQLAISDHDGSATLNVYPQSQQSSLLQAEGIGAPEGITVTTSRLDTLLASPVHRQHDFNVCIIDTQGNESSVIKGASESLAKFDLVIIETTFGLFYRGAATGYEIEQAMNENGLQASSASPFVWRGGIGRADQPFCVESAFGLVSLQCSARQEEFRRVLRRLKRWTDQAMLVEAIGRNALSRSRGFLLRCPSQDAIRADFQNYLQTINEAGYEHWVTHCDAGFTRTSRPTAQAQPLWG